MPYHTLVAPEPRGVSLPVCGPDYGPDSSPAWPGRRIVLDYAAFGLLGFGLCRVMIVAVMTRHLGKAVFQQNC